MTDPLDLIEARLHALGKKVVRKGDKLDAQCPAHDDRNPSFGVTRGNVRPVVLNCQAGCDPEAIMSALGFAWTDLGESATASTPPAEYLYVDGKGRPVYKVCRGPNKKFWQQHIDWSGEWVNGIKGITPLPYHLDELVIAAERRRTIWIAEGEKDVDRLRAEGVCATCNSGGAGNWRSSLDEWFNGADVVIVADNDEPGRKHAEDVKTRLEARGCTVKIVRAAAGKDAFDHFAAGFTIDQFIGEGEPDDPWEPLLPLTVASSPPSFPVHVLPDWMRDQAEAVSDALQAPVDIACVVGLGAISVATIGNLRVCYPWENWTQPCGLYIAAVAPPSVGKSPVKSAMFAALEKYEQERVASFASERRIQAERVDIAKNRLTAHKKTMNSDDSPLAHDTLDDLICKLAEAEAKMPPSGRLLADDATVEALGMVVADAGGSIGVVSAEGGLFDRLAGLYNENGMNLDLYLEGWSGGRYVVDRVKRDPITVPSATLSVVTTIQPHTLDAIGAKKAFAGRGLTARFLISLPHSNVGGRLRGRKLRNTEAISERYGGFIETIARRFADRLTVLTLDDDACGLFAEWDQRTEYRVAPGQDLHDLAEWVGKLRGSVIRVAAILHAAYEKDGDVDGDDMARAIEVGNYFIAHMSSIVERWGLDEGIATARALLDWIGRNDLDTFTVRDVYSGNRRLTPTPDDTLPPLRVLVSTNHIRPMFDGPITIGRGGRPSPKFAVNPAVRAVRAVRAGAGEGGVRAVDQKGRKLDEIIIIPSSSPPPPPDRTARTGSTGLSQEGTTLLAEPPQKVARHDPWDPWPDTPTPTDPTTIEE